MDIHTIDSGQELLHALQQHEADRKLRLGMDYHDGALWYGLEFNSKLFFLSTGRRSFSQRGLPKGVLSDTGSISGSPMSGEGIRRYLKGDTVNGAALIQDIETFFATHAKFQQPAIPTVLALWVLAGYAHMAFSNFAYLWITSPQRSCGKTRVLELLAPLGFRCGQIQVNPTAAVLYRSLHSTAQVLVVDEFENSTDETKQALITVLNSGFSRGATVSRCTGREYSIESFAVYGPKAFAGLNQLPDTLASRTIEIGMLPKTQADNILPFSPALYESQLTRWRDDLAIWALENAPAAAHLGVTRDELGMPQGLDDRAADYMAPLFAVAKAAGYDLAPLSAFCKRLAESRGEQVSDGSSARAVAALREWLGDRSEARLALEDAAQIFKNALLWDFHDSRSAGHLLRKMGFEVRQLRLDSRSAKGTLVTRRQLDDLSQRFPITHTAVEVVLPTAA